MVSRPTRFELQPGVPQGAANWFIFLGAACCCVRMTPCP